MLRSVLSISMIAILCAPKSVCSESDRLLHVVSSRADSVSGGTVLLQLEAPSVSDATILVNGSDVTSFFRRSDRSGKLLALIGGLNLGRNTLEARIAGASELSRVILNHPISGPISSGPHQRPFICETEANGLGMPLDTDCSAESIVQYYYKSTESNDLVPKIIDRHPAAADLNFATSMPGFKRYDPAGPRPTDITPVVLRNGKTTDYIVRRELGVINRAVYEIQFVHDFTEPPPTPWTPVPSTWNGSLLYVFGGGCGAGYHQGVLPNAIHEAALSMGYAVATSSLNHLANNCNEKLSSETASMIKEYFIKQYGQPDYTIGMGVSSGAVSAYLSGQNYPGILDGIIAYASAPDHLTSVIPVFSDCALLVNALDGRARSWTEVQRTAVAGFATWQTCVTAAALLRHLGWLDPKSCHSSLPEKIIYDRKSNPQGIRCTFWDNAVNTFGVDPRTGFARRTLDNVGVQYGLVAFNAGIVDAEQFIDLNERIGGFDLDGQIVPMRSVADEASIRIARRHGAVMTGKNLADIPIIDLSLYADDLGNTHTRDRAFITRLRLMTSSGDAQNQAIIVAPRPIQGTDGGDRDIPGVGPYVLLPAMHQWLASISKDVQQSPRLEAIVHNRPSELADNCIHVSGARIFEPATFQGDSKCNGMYPSHGNPRLAAGAPAIADIIKCHLAPLDPSAYSTVLTASQIERLQKVFPTGVCDYSRSGIGNENQPVPWHAIR